MASTLRKILCFALLGFLTLSFLPPPPRPSIHLITLAGGYVFGGPRHSGGAFELEYHSPKRCFSRYLRPQVTLFFPEFSGVFIGAGLAFEVYLCKHLVFCPSFEPGYYFHSRSRDLYCPIEFRSCLEFAVEGKKGGRLGLQFFHISNARLGRHNPGINAFMVALSFPH